MKDEDIQKLLDELNITDDDLKAVDESGAKFTLLCTGENDDGIPCYAYISILPSKLLPMKVAEETGHINYEDYGEIIKFGEGATPPDDVRKFMEEEYNFNHNLEEQIVESVKKEHKKHDLINQYSGKKDK